MENTLTAGGKVAADISALLRARNPLLWIVTREEARAERLIMEAAQAAQYEPRFWDCANGITAFNGDPEVIRDAANKARQIAGMLSADVAGKVGEAIEEARKAARDITKRVIKGAELADVVVRGITTAKLDAARFAVLDLDTPAATQAVELTAPALDVATMNDVSEIMAAADDAREVA